MSVWSRNKLIRGTTYSEEINENRGLSLLVEGNPLSTHFKNPCGDSPKDLVNYLVACQMRVFGSSIDMDNRILIRNVKLLLNKYDVMVIKRAIKYSNLVAKHPYSFKFVEEIIKQNFEVW